MLVDPPARSLLGVLVALSCAPERPPPAAHALEPPRRANPGFSAPRSEPVTQVSTSPVDAQAQSHAAADAMQKTPDAVAKQEPPWVPPDLAGSDPNELLGRRYKQGRRYCFRVAVSGGLRYTGQAQFDSPWAVTWSLALVQPINMQLPPDRDLKPRFQGSLEALRLTSGRARGLAPRALTVALAFLSRAALRRLNLRGPALDSRFQHTAWVYEGTTNAGAEQPVLFLQDPVTDRVTGFEYGSGGGQLGRGGNFIQFLEEAALATGEKCPFDR